MFETRSLVQALSKLKPEETFDMDSLLVAAASFDADFLQQLAGSGCKMFGCQQKRFEVVYIPLGWLSVEVCVGGVVVMGIRKGYMTKSAKSKQNLACVLELQGRCNPAKDTSRLSAIMSKMD